MDQYWNQLKALIGTKVEREDPSNPDQCMDFAFAWCDITGINRAAIRHQFAYQVAYFSTQNPVILISDATILYLEYIPNTPNFLPKRGDFAVFDKNIKGLTGSAGHICVVDDGADINTFPSLDQNWNGKQYVTQERHNYAGVLAFLRPRMFITYPASQDQINAAVKPYQDKISAAQKALA